MTKPLNKHEVISFLQNCKKVKNLAQTKLIYEQIRESGLDSDRDVGNHLVPALVECGSLRDAHKVFSKLVQPNSCSWTSIIYGYVEDGDFEHALDIFQRMQAASVQPSMFTFLVLLKACTQLVSLKSGRAIHSEVVKYHFEREPYVCNSLMDMYAKCGSLAEARKLFDGLQTKDVVTWTTLIGGYVDHGLDRMGLICFEQMQFENVDPNAVTYFYCLKACVNTKSVEKGCEIHVEMAKNGFERDILAAGMLLDFYAKLVSMDEAQVFFDDLAMKDAVLWTTLIAGYTDQGLYEQAMSCFQQMKNACVAPDLVTFVCTLKACGNLGTLLKGLELHMNIIKEGYDDLILGSILMDMYIKCGLLIPAKKLFTEFLIRDTIAWTAFMSGYAYQGEYDLVIHYFDKMREEGIEPNATTFLIIFSVCNYAGLVSRGLCHFQGMAEEFGILPSIKHHNSMADLFGRAGQLNEVSMILQKMPIQPNVASWETVMGSCQKWHNFELARQAYESAQRLDNYHSGIFVLMSNIYADIGEC